MSASVVEIVGSQSGEIGIDNPTQELLFIGIGDDVFANMAAAVEAALPATISVVSAFFGVRTLVCQGYTIKHTGNGNWEGRATYGRRPPRKTGDLYLSFDSTGGTQHITTSKETVGSYARTAASTAPTGLVATPVAGGQLAAGTYYYVVTAVNSAGVESLASGQVSAVTSGGNLAVFLSWATVLGTTTYRIYRSTTSGTYTTPSLVGTTPDNAITDRAALPIAAGAPPSVVATAETAPDFKRAIGVNNSTVEGTDIPSPVFKFTLNYYPAVALMTGAYISAINDLTDKTNDGPVDLGNGSLPFDEGELLFLGASGQPRSLDDWELLFHFSASANATDIQVGDISGIAKEGWQYLWLQFCESTQANSIIKVPRFAYVERTFEKGNFSDLGLDGIPIIGIT